MTLQEELSRRIQEIGDVAGQPGREEEFTARYAALLGELIQAMNLMRELAILQGGWLQGQAGQQGRTN